jgi:hypothetical protein
VWKPAILEPRLPQLMLVLDTESGV